MLLNSGAFCQEIESPLQIQRSVIGASGKAMTSPDGKLSIRSAVGQASPIEIHQNPSAQLCQGFIQPDGILLSGIAPELQVKLYPNPTDRFTTLSSDQSLQNIFVKIIDNNGTLVFAQEIDTDIRSFELDLEDIPIGIHHILLMKGNQILSSNKLVKI